MKLEMQMVPRLELRLKLAPPIAATAEEAVSHAVKRTRRDLSEETLSEVDKFVRTENTRKPYSDAEILAHMHGLGHNSMTRSEIAYARNQLGIKPTLSRGIYPHQR